MVKSPTFPETIYYELPLSKHISTSRTHKRVTWTEHFIKNTPKDVSRADNAKIKNNDKPIPRLDFGPILQSFDGSEGEKESDIVLTIDHEYEHKHLIDNYQSIKDEPPNHPLPTDFFGHQESPQLTNHQTSMMIPSLKQVSVYTPMLEQIRTRPEQGAYTADIIVRSESQPLDSQSYDHQCRILARQPKESYFSSVPSTNIPISQGQEQVEQYNGSFDQSISSLPSWYPYFSNSLDTLPKDQQDRQERPLLSNKISINSISSPSTSVDWPLFLINSTDNSNYSISTQTAIQECTHPGKSPAGNTPGIVRNEVEHCGGEVFVKSCEDVLEDWKRKTIFGAIRQNESAWQGEDGNEGKDGQGIGSTSEWGSGQQNAQDNDDEGRVFWDGRPLERQRSGSPLQNLASVMIIKPFNPKSLFLLVHQTSRPEYLFLNCPLNQTLLNSMSTIPRGRCRLVGITFYQTNFHCVPHTPTPISRRSRLASQQRTCRKQDGQDPRKGH